ncbi:PTS transporter subunit EIIC, partial [Collinsella sp.]
MIAWAESKVEKFLTKVVPDMANLLVVPLFTILIMAPIALCAFGPLGSVLGVVLENFLLGFKQVFGPVGIGLISAMFTPLIATGMHTPIILSGFATLAEQGSEGVIFAGGVAMTFSCIAAGLGYMLKAKDTNDRELGLSCFTTQTLVGIGEPTIFGILLPNPKMLGFQMAGAFAGGVYA